MNLAVLLMARASARTREMAVRVALGATGSRLRRQMLAEVLPLCIAGTGAGLVVAWWMLRVMVPYLPANMPRLASIQLNGPVMIFAAAICAGVVVLASLLPGRAAAKSNPGSSLQQNSRAVTGGGRTRSLLVVAQIAITLVLLFGGTLFARSFSALLGVSPGFSDQGILTLHLAVTRAKYHEDERVADYYQRMVQRVKSIPGVTGAGIVNRLPMSGISQTGGVEFEGRDGVYDADWRSATPGYFEAIGIPLRAGRVFLDSDRPKSAPVGLIDERLAWAVFGTENPVGKRFRSSRSGSPQRDPWSEIVGVVGHILNDSLEKDLRPQVYWPETQRTQDRGALVIRTSGRPESYAKAVVEQIREEDADQPVYDVRTMEEWFGRSLQSRILLTGVVTLFSVASLLLACLGLYGVVSYSANSRFREFGIRMALGAGKGHVRALVLRQAGLLAVAGCAVGAAFAWPAGRALQSLLFGVTNGDLAAWITAPAVLLAVALLAGLGPARRAAKADPAVTLRAD